MKVSNANKVISVLLSVAMCPMMVPSAAFAADDDAASDASSPSEQTQSADQAEGVDAGASLSDTIALQSEATDEVADASTGEAAAPVAAATVNGYPTLEEAVQNATVDAQGAITYEVTGKVNVGSTGWVQVRPAAATNAKVVKFVGKSDDAEICITQGAAILADQKNSALSVEFNNLTLSKLNPEWAQDFGHSTNYFTTWLRNADAASNCVTYTDCEFPNGVCNNQYGKTVFDNCTFSNAKSGLYNMWVYGGNVEVKGGSFAGARGVKVFTEGTATVAPKIAIEGTSFKGVSERAAIVVSKPAAVTLSNVSATDCAKGLIQKAIEGSSEEDTLNTNGTGIGGNFDITAKTGSDATKAEFNLNAGTLTSEVSSDFLADGFTLSKSSDNTFGVAKAAPAGVAEVNGKTYSSLQDAINAASRNATVKLLADTKENVTISTPYVTLDLNGYTLNGGTEKGKPALTVTARVTVKDSSEAKTGTIMREDTAENSGVSSHYVIDVQGSGWLTFESGNVTNNSGTESGKGASLVRVGDDSVDKYPGLNIKGGTFTQDNFIVIKVDSGDLFLNGGTLNSANSYAIEDWHRATIKGGTVNGTVAVWTYSGGHNSDLSISGGTVNGNVASVSYDKTEGKLAKVSISGGTVNGTLGTYTYGNGLIPIDDTTKATIEVTSGTFSTDPSRYLVEGSAAIQNADGTYGVEKAYLAQVGETSYYTMGEAFDAQTKTGEAITLLRDYTTGGTFNSGTGARVVDLNGHTWTCTGTDANSAAFEINYPNASLTVKNGKVVSSQLIGLIPSAMGGTITYDNSTLTFEGVEASTTATSGIETNGNNTNDTVVLKDSTLNVPNGFGIYFPSSGTLTIDNSTINAKTMGAQVCSGSLNVNSGSVITVSGDPVAKTENDGAIQDGAAISIVNRPGYKGLGQIAITGGTFTAKDANAAIKAYTWDSSTKQESDFDNTAKTVAVYGGTFSSAVASDLCAEGYAPVANADGSYSVGAPVAQIGGNVFTSLQAAIDAAQDGDTVQLLGDVEQNSQLNIDKSITLDLNGKTIENTVDIWGDNANAILSIKDGAKVAITGSGTMDAKENDCYTINVVKGDLTIENGTFYGNISVVQVQEGTLSVKGGTFDLHQKWEGSSKYLINCIDKAYASGSAKVAISGGTFVGFDPNVSPEQKVDGKVPSFAAPGVGITKNEDGSFTAAARMTAQILDKDGNSVKAYATLADAVAAAQDGETITLLTDATEDVAINKSITLDLGGKTLTNTNAGKATISVQGGTVTVKNGNVMGGTGYYNIEVTKGSNANLTLADVTATAGNTGSSMIDNWGTLTIESGTYTGGMDTVKSEEGSTLTINGGTFTCDFGKKWSYTAVILVYGDTTINGGEFIQKTTNTSSYAKVVMTGKVDGYEATTKVTGGKFVNEKLSGIFWALGKATSDNFEVSGGTFNKYVSDSFMADGYIPVKNSDGTYGVKEGKFVAEVGSTGYETFDEAIAAANASTKSANIYLRENITVDHQLVINNAKGKTITLNLKGFTLTSTYEINADIKNGSYALVNNTPLTIKNGTFAAGQARAIGALEALTLDGATVTQALTGGHACVAFCADGKTYTVKNNSAIEGAYAVCNFANNSTINITGSKLIGTGNTLYHNGSNYGLKLTVKDTTITSSGSCGVYISGSSSAQSNADNQNGAGGYQKATFTGCTISGAINGVEVKYTDLTLDSCTASTTAKDASYKQDNNGPAGSGFAVVSTDNAMNNVTPKPEGTIIIKGEGKYTGPVGLGSLKSVKETYADFADETINISDGTFTNEVPAAYCADGYIPTQNEDGTYGVKLAEGAYLLQDYRSGEQTSWTYPTQDGKAFAGWYKDASFTTPCTARDVEGAAYAKFVNITDLLKFKGGSLRMDKGVPSESTYLRFGYTKAIPEKATYIENGWYYKRLSAPTSGDRRLVAYNNALNNDGTITSNLVFNGVAKNYYTANFTEKAFVKYITVDGTTVEAVEDAYHLRSVSEVADAILAHPMASEAEKDYATSIKSAIQ